jgi:hypothetical protein
LRYFHTPFAKRKNRPALAPSVGKIGASIKAFRDPFSQHFHPHKKPNIPQIDILQLILRLNQIHKPRFSRHFMGYISLYSNHLHLFSVALKAMD